MTIPGSKHIYFLPLTDFNTCHSVFCCICELTAEKKNLWAQFIALASERQITFHCGQFVV